jgi:hypothetical protein
MPISIEADPTLAQGYIKVNGTTAATITTTGISGNLNPSVITAQTQLADPLASGDEFLVHDLSATALRRVAFNAMQPAGSVLQTVQTTKTSLQVCSTAIPWDDTIPQNTEGDEIFTASITPSSASNKILVRVTTYGAASAGWYTIAVFKDSDANAIAAAWGIGQNVDYQSTTTIEYLHSPATTSAITYKVRAGSSSGSYRLNGAINSAGRLFGGVSFSNITLQEIKG